MPTVDVTVRDRHRWPACVGERRVLANTVKAAELAGVTVRTIYNWRRLGLIEWVYTPNRRGIRIYVDSLLRRPPED